MVKTTKKHERNVLAKTLARKDAAKRRDEFRKGGERAHLQRKLRQTRYVSHEEVMQLIENPIFKKKELRRRQREQRKRAKIEEYKENSDKFAEKGNKAAGTRARKALSEITKLAKARRKEIQVQLWGSKPR